MLIFVTLDKIKFYGVFVFQNTRPRYSKKLVIYSHQPILNFVQSPPQDT